MVEGRTAGVGAYNPEFVSILFADRACISADEGTLRVEDKGEWGVMGVSSLA
jgi:hypothetical protein